MNPFNIFSKFAALSICITINFPTNCNAASSNQEYLRPFDVCALLSDPQAHFGTNIAVRGYLTDFREYNGLSSDKCEDSLLKFAINDAVPLGDKEVENALSKTRMTSGERVYVTIIGAILPYSLKNPMPTLRSAAYLDIEIVGRKP